MLRTYCDRLASGLQYALAGHRHRRLDSRGPGERVGGDVYLLRMGVPAISLSFLADFTNAQGTARAALVEQQYRQRMQEGDRFWTLNYADVFAAAEQVVAAQGDLEPLRRAVNSAPEKKQRSYAAVAQGLATLLTKFKPTTLKRGSAALWQDPNSDTQIRVRPHFIATLPKDANEAWFLNCKEEPLAAPCSRRGLAPDAEAWAARRAAGVPAAAQREIRPVAKAASQCEP